MHIRRTLLLGLTASTLVALLAACGTSRSLGVTSGSKPALQATSAAIAASTDSAAAITAVATTSILADLVANVGGDRVSITALLPAGVDPHTFSPGPTEARAVADAQIVFENGAGLEEWLAELIANAGGERPTAIVSEGVATLQALEHGHDEEAGEPSAEEEHAEEGVDPHMWFDPQNVVVYVENIRDGLKQIDPDGAAPYDANAARYIEQLRELDAQNEQQLAAIPPQRRKLVTNHDTFAYFARRYDFELVGTVFEGVSTEEEPSPRQVAELVERIREAGVPAIFAENTVNTRLAEQIAAEAGVEVVTGLYTDALGEPGSPGDTYLNMMRHDVATIVEALT